MNITELGIIWNEVSDIPINTNDEIEQNFHFWDKGTCRFDIWHWFDEKLPNGIAEWFAV